MGDHSKEEQWFWAEEFDLSKLSYQEFIAFFFDRPVVDDDKQYELFHSGIDYFVASHPATVVAHLQAMCESYSELATIHSHEQLDQGLWGLFGDGRILEQSLFDPGVDRTLRIDCIDSMYLPFYDVVARSSLDKNESFYWMWWDIILHTFWITFSEANDRYDALTEDARQMLDVILKTLSRILALDQQACQWSALHGLGHSLHPGAREIVQTYLDLHRTELSSQEAEWVERCREGKLA